MEVLIENFNKVVNGFQVDEVVVGNINTDAKIEASVTTVDNLEVTELHSKNNKYTITKNNGSLLYR